MERRRVSSAVVVTVAMLLAWDSSSKALACQAVNTPDRSASIEGSVTLDGRPMPGVVVRAVPNNFEPSRKALARASTNKDGTFRLVGLTAGEYIVSAAAPGYVSRASSPFTRLPGLLVAIRKGDVVRDVAISLERGGVVTGRVVDGNGDPAVSTEVALLSADGPAKGTRVTFPRSEIGRTDDRGVYRIYGIPMGRYILRAGTPTGVAPENFESVGSYFPVTYYPNTTIEAEATVVEVSPGRVVDKVDIVLGNASQGLSLEGVAIDVESGAPVLGAAVRFTSFVATYVQGVGGKVVTDSTGRFRIAGLMPGRYDLSILPDRTQGDAYFGELLSVELLDVNLTGLVLKARRGGLLRGVVVFGENAQVRAQEVSLLAVSISGPEGSRIAPDFQSTSPTSEGSFELLSPPGLVRLALDGLRSPRNVSIVTVERQGSVIGSDLNIEPGSTIDGLSVVLGVGTGIIERHVRPMDAVVASHARLVVVAQLVDGLRQRRSANVDARGQFRFDALLEGEYQVRLAIIPNSANAVPMAPPAAQSGRLANGENRSDEYDVEVQAETQN